MKRKFNIKVNGESIRSIFLTFILAKLNCNVYVNDFLNDSNSNKDNQTFVFSNSSKSLLNKFDIWNEIENISYPFTSLSINDNLVSEKLLLRSENFSIKYLNTFGWAANYSDIKRLLISKLINSDNIHFISENQLIDENLIFDYEFNFKNYDKLSKSFKLPILNFEKIDEQILIFNIYLRGHIEKRLYKINTSKGLLVLTPLNKNLYQVIWNNASSLIKERSLNSKSFLLDNLTTLLPNELKIDQIIGDIKFVDASKTFSNCLIKKKSIYFNENKFKLNNIYDFNFYMIMINILKIFNFIYKNEPIMIKILDKSGFYYLYRKYLEMLFNLSFSNSLYSLFTVNNIFSLFIRKLLFILIKRTNLLKVLFIKNPNNYNISNLIKLEDEFKNIK